ncbi:ABC transporter, ATP-binding protein [Prevotella disiens JCM 6334 = ATCC 29426]|uniref:ABC-type transporter ATP-binding protein EcsA n=3 Tax=Prevotella disiens TaxID=28130 RepID=A0A379EFU6_9BACT|nr:ABC transporter ATP-binding protein [Prevotella disiens]ERJ75053.1 ABC transporter, ATP-binding protein [Prevotella disiens JCM 6334 = ATCC 29426]SUB97671.1 ABC-type transporter ATP-binding protein EcsA [Prevotella disiens]
MEIKIENLKKIYGENTVIDIPEFTISDGQLIGLVGNNGAGKTTLMRLMLDLIKANEGRVLSNGNAVNEDFAWKQYTGSFVDKSFLIDFYTPEEFFQFIADAYDIDSETLEERLQEFMPLMRDEILGTGKLIREFSEGNRQKIGIIGAMIVRPELLILDEPFNYLDPSSQINIAKIIHQVNQKYGTTVLISSHNLNFISEICSRVVLMEKGKIIKDMNNENQEATHEMEDYFNQ